MFIRIRANTDHDQLINLNFVKEIVNPKYCHSNQVRYYRSEEDYYTENFETAEEAYKRYIEICKLLNAEIKNNE